MKESRKVLRSHALNWLEMRRGGSEASPSVQAGLSRRGMDGSAAVQTDERASQTRKDLQISKCECRAVQA